MGIKVGNPVQQTPAEKQAAKRTQHDIALADALGLREDLQLGNLLGKLPSGEGRDELLRRLLTGVIKDGRLDLSGRVYGAHFVTGFKRSAALTGGAEDNFLNLTVNPDDYKSFTIKEFKAVLAHEMFHSQQPRGASDRASELAADHFAASVYGGQTMVDALAKLSARRPINYNPPAGADHPSTRERQLAIIRAFPEEKIEIVHPVAAPERGLSPSAFGAGSGVLTVAAIKPEFSAVAVTEPTPWGAGLPREAACVIEACRATLSGITKGEGEVPTAPPLPGGLRTNPRETHDR